MSFGENYAEPAGIAGSEGSYIAIYTNGQGKTARIAPLDAGGNSMPPGEQALASATADTFGGPIVRLGDGYATAWQDRRFGNYEVFFSVLGSSGNKVLPEVRLSEAPGFSIAPSLCRRGEELTVIWQDDEASGKYEVHGQRVDANGGLLGGVTKLTTSAGVGVAAPSVACGPGGVGVAWREGDPQTGDLRFQTFDPSLAPVTAQPITLTGGNSDPRGAAVVWAGDRYVVAWSDESASPHAIHAAAVAEDGTVLVPATVITQPGAGRSRFPALRVAGERVIVAYQDNRDDNQGYEIYVRIVAKDLTPVGDEVRITTAPNDSTTPHLARGPAGDLGVLFSDYEPADLTVQVYFARVTCETPP
ncbi:MAG: hypothetical protein R3B70_27000 [Polyangiaceae bacterium]